jgi:hypothetical protein
VLLDRDGTIAKAIEAIDEAADAGASLLVFPEAWIPGYPTWVWTRFEHASEAHDANTDRFSAMVMSGSRTTSIGWRKALEGCSRACQMYLPGLKVLLQHEAVPARHHQVKSTGRHRLNARTSVSAIAVDRDAADIAFRFGRFRHRAPFLKALAKGR